MSLSASISKTVLDTILGRLTCLFLTGAAGDEAVARQAASHMLAAYHVETEDELGLAAEIISLRLHTLEALSDAADPDLPLNKILRLRGGAVSLSREAHKSQRKLDQLQRDRRAGIPAQPAENQPEKNQPTIAQSDPAPTNRPPTDHPLGVLETARAAVKIAAKKGGKSWAQAFQQRQTANRIAENLKKNQALHAGQSANAP